MVTSVIFFIKKIIWIDTLNMKIGWVFMAMEMDKIELMVELQVFTHIHDQRVVHR